MRNQSGTYVLEPGKGLVKVSEAIPTLARPVYFNKGGVKQYDPSARETFHSKAEKREWLTTHGMREGGLIQKKSRWDWGRPSKNSRPMSPEARTDLVRRQQWIQAQGGTEGLLKRLQAKKGI